MPDPTEWTTQVTNDTQAIIDKGAEALTRLTQDPPDVDEAIAEVEALKLLAEAMKLRHQS